MCVYGETIPESVAYRHLKHFMGMRMVADLLAELAASRVAVETRVGDVHCPACRSFANDKVYLPSAMPPTFFKTREKLMDARAGRRGDEYTVYQGGRRMWRGPSRNPSGKYLSVNTQPLASGFGGDRSIIVITATSAPAATENQAYVPLRDSPESKSRTRQSCLSVCLSVSSFEHLRTALGRRLSLMF